MLSDIRRRCESCRILLRRVKAPRKYGLIFKCRRCGGIWQDTDGQIRTTEVTKLIAQTGVCKFGAIIKPHQLRLLGPTL